jgi:hypothetical protein
MHFNSINCFGLHRASKYFGIKWILWHLLRWVVVSNTVWGVRQSADDELYCVSKCKSMNPKIFCSLDFSFGSFLYIKGKKGTVFLQPWLSLVTFLCQDKKATDKTGTCRKTIRADRIYPKGRLSDLAAENKKLKKTNIILTIFLILVFISQYIEHWSDLFRW